MNAFSYLIFSGATLLLVGCGQSTGSRSATAPSELSSADRIATRVAEERAVAATLAADARANATSVTPIPAPPTDAPVAPSVTSAVMAEAPPTDAPVAPSVTPEIVAEVPIAYRDIDFTGFPVPGSTVQIGGQELVITGGLQISGIVDFRDTIPVVHDAFALRVPIRVGATGDSDGAGVKDVLFSIDSDQGDHYERTGINPSYCAFGGGEPDCTLWSPSGERWPDGTPFSPGLHTVSVTIQLKESDTQINWSTQIIIEKPE